MVATILFITANPLDTPKIDAESEVRSVRESVSRSIFHVELIPAARAADFQRSLIETQPVIVHWSGHGMQPSRGGGGAPHEREVAPTQEEQRPGTLVVQDEHGNAEAIPTHALADLFRILRDEIPTRCVVLNACFTEDQAAAIAEHVDFVIGTTRAIPDEAAITFSKQFYYALAEGRSLMTAFELGRNAVALSGGDASILKSWSRPGVDPKQIHLREHSPSMAPPPPSAPLHPFAPPPLPAPRSSAPPPAPLHPFAPPPLPAPRSSAPPPPPAPSPPTPVKPTKREPSAGPKKVWPILAGAGVVAVLGVGVFLMMQSPPPRPPVDVDTGKRDAGSTSSVTSSSHASSSAASSPASASSWSPGGGAAIDADGGASHGGGVDARLACPSVCCGGEDCKPRGAAVAMLGQTNNCPSGRSCVPHACDYDLPKKDAYLLRAAVLTPSKPGEVIPKDTEICMRRSSHPEDKWICTPHQALLQADKRHDAQRLPITMEELTTTGVDFSIRFNRRVVSSRTGVLLGSHIHARALCMGLIYKDVGSYAVTVHLDDAH